MDFEVEYETLNTHILYGSLLELRPSIEYRRSGRQKSESSSS